MVHAIDQKIIVTGGAGFIGSNFVLQWIEKEKASVVTLDKLTYAGNLNNLAKLELNPRHTFIKGDILDRNLVGELLHKHSPKAIVHFAAETHVDRSIHHPESFVKANVSGTCALLDEALKYWKHLPPTNQEQFRFLYVSTDEVYGSLSADAKASKEGDPYAPNSPYAASKASADHFVRAYHRTYRLPTITTYASNNFGPYQFPEKLIPLVIVNALQGQPLPIYGDGLQIRNWLHVEEHCQALRLLLSKGVPGECYNIGGQHEMTNKELVGMICDILDKLKMDSPCLPHSSLIKYVKDRPGHDRRYALDSSKILKQCGWRSSDDFKLKLYQTVVWYLDNLRWLENVVSGDYRQWMNAHYSEKESI